MFSHVSPGLLPTLITGLLAQQITRPARERPVKDDLSGMEFGRLTVLREATKEEQQHKSRGYTYWLCRCVCGTESVIRGHSLKTGGTQSCGCSMRDTKKHQSRRIEMAGQRFGRFTVIRAATDEEMAIHKTQEAFWLCRCDCGNERIVRGSNLRYGKSKSCGCAKLDSFRQTIKAKK